MTHASNSYSSTMRRAHSLAAALLLLLCSVARGEWRVISSEPQGTARGGVVHVKTVVASDEGARATLHFATFSPKTATLRVIDDPDARSALADAMQRENAVAGVNGGYFAPDYGVVGLSISDGRVADLLRPGPVLLRLAVRGFGVSLAPG